MRCLSFRFDRQVRCLIKKCCVSTDSYGEMGVLYLYLFKDIWSYELVYILNSKEVFLQSHLTANTFFMHQSTTGTRAKTNLVVDFTSFLSRENRKGKLNLLREPRVIEWSVAPWWVEMRLETAACREVSEYTYSFRQPYKTNYLIECLAISHGCEWQLYQLRKKIFPIALPSMVEAENVSVQPCITRNRMKENCTTVFNYHGYVHFVVVLKLCIEMPKDGHHGWNL
jgi:hypothetical protein